MVLCSSRYREALENPSEGVKRSTIETSLYTDLEKLKGEEDLNFSALAREGPGPWGFEPTLSRV